MRLLLSSLLALFLIASPASAQSTTTIDRLSVESVGTALTAAGFRYIEAVDSRGYPVLQVDGTPLAANNFTVFFYSCNEQGSCEDITLWSWYNANRLTLDQTMHTWNDIFRESRNWSRGYVDGDGDPVLTMNINATGGIGSDNLQVMINTYVSEARDFSALVTTR